IERGQAVSDIPAGWRRGIAAADAMRLDEMDSGLGGSGIEPGRVRLPHGVADRARAGRRRPQPVIGCGVEPFEQALHLARLPMWRLGLNSGRKSAKKKEDKQPDHEPHLCQSAAADNAGYYGGRIMLLGVQRREQFSRACLADVM